MKGKHLFVNDNLKIMIRKFIQIERSKIFKCSNKDSRMILRSCLTLKKSKYHPLPPSLPPFQVHKNTRISRS